MDVQQFQNHPLRNSITALLSMREHEIFADPEITNNAALADGRDRIFSLAAVIDGMLRETPAPLVSIQGLNAIEQQVQQVLAELTAMQSDRSSGHLSNAVTYFENVQTLFWTFSPTVSPSGASLLPALLAEQARSAQQAVAALVANRDDALGRFHALKTEADGLAIQLREVTEGAARERAEAAASVAKLETAFAKEQLERDAANALALSTLDSDFKLFAGTAKSDAAAIITELGEQKDQAAQIVQVVGNIGVTGNYQQIAESEKKQANLWRWLTVANFAIGISVAVATFCRYWNEPVTGVNAASIAVRLLYAIAITAPAWYTARESARHRTNSDRAKQTELELASIGPFIELMPDDKKNAIREELTKRYFGREVAEHKVEQPIAFADFRDLIIEGIKAVRK
jgi:hypothetical protein